jgi:hypothetical protein
MLEQASRWCRRRPAIALLLAVLAFTVASCLVDLLTPWRHSEAERARAEDALALAIESDQASSGPIGPPHILSARPWPIPGSRRKSLELADRAG